MCFQRSSERIEGESRPLKPGWKVIPQSRTGSRETPIAKFVVSSWDEQLGVDGVVGGAGAWFIWTRRVKPCSNSHSDYVSVCLGSGPNRYMAD